MMSLYLAKLPRANLDKGQRGLQLIPSFSCLGLSLRSRPLFHREIGSSLTMNENRSGWLTAPVLNYLLVLSWQSFPDLKEGKKKKKKGSVLNSFFEIHLLFNAGLPGLSLLASSWINSGLGTTGTQR